jgi:hypothetical protein
VSMSTKSAVLISSVAGVILPVLAILKSVYALFCAQAVSQSALRQCLNLRSGSVSICAQAVSQSALRQCQISVNKAVQLAINLIGLSIGSNNGGGKPRAHNLMNKQVEQLQSILLVANYLESRTC